MTGFNYTCPKCSRKGSNSDLGCYNCDHRVVIGARNGGSVLTCSNCGLDQLPTCPSCGSVITWKKIEEHSIEEHSSIVGVIIVIVVAVFLMKNCGGDKPNNQTNQNDQPPAVVDNPLNINNPELNNNPEPAPHSWTVPAEVQPTPNQHINQEPTPAAQDQQPTESQWTVPKEE